MRVDAVTAMHRRQYARWNQPAFEQVLGHYHVLPEQKVAQLSRGERAGFNLALALAQRPELLVLDEPTLGLDVVAKRAFLESLMQSNVADDCTGHLLLAPDGGDRARRRQPDHPRARRADEHVAAGGLRRARALLGRRHSLQGAGSAQHPRPAGSAEIDGLHHYVVLDQDEDFAEFLRRSGARNVQSMPVSLDRAVNSFLAKNHAAPPAAAAA
jgi:ABC-2 type transport system ATP-binding protein